MLRISFRTRIAGVVVVHHADLRSPPEMTAPLRGMLEIRRLDLARHVGLESTVFQLTPRSLCIRNVTVDRNEDAKAS